MDLDADALRWAKLPALERLARALKVTPPRQGPRYFEALRHRVAQAIEDDKRQAAAEDRRVMDEKKIAAEIADALGETGKRPRRQIARIVALMGEAWARDSLSIAHAVRGDVAYAVAKTTDGAARTLGGVFFAECRRKAQARLKDGEFTRREFFRCFFDYPAKVRAPKPPPKAKPAPKAKPVRRVETRVPQAQSKPRRQVTAPEVYVARRRS